MNGKIKWFDAKKGFGFIAPEDGGGDVFVHFGDLDEGLKTLQTDDKVTFEVADTPRGRKASRVRMQQG
jgi:CspA family cold shock protein